MVSKLPGAQIFYFSFQTKLKKIGLEKYDLDGNGMFYRVLMSINREVFEFKDQSFADSAHFAALLSTLFLLKISSHSFASSFPHTRSAALFSAPNKVFGS